MVMNIGSAVKGLVIGIIGVVIIFLLVSNLANDLQNAGNNMSTSGLDYYVNSYNHQDRWQTCLGLTELSS